MKLKTYRAQSMAEALSQVKKDLGKEAVILHTRSVNVGGILGFGRKTVVELTAADEPVGPGWTRTAAKPRPETVEPQRPSNAPILAASAAARAYRRTAEIVRPQQPTARPTTDSPAPGHPTSVPPARPALRTTGIEPPTATPARATPASPQPEPIVMSVRERRTPDPRPEPQRQARPERPAPAPRQPAPAPAPQQPAATSDLHRELADIKLLVNQVLQASPTGSGFSSPGGAMPEALFRHYMRLLEASVSREIADSIIGAVRDELTPGEMQEEEIVRTTVLRHLSNLIPVSEVTRVQPGAGPLVIALVGATGVGKTTTIAKLAAAYKLRHGKSVALITSDTYRIAAVDQLRTYAGIIGLPLKVVLTPQEMAAAVDSLRGYDVVLIDTAGRSQFNSDRIAELRQFIDAAGPQEIHLVLSSIAGPDVLSRTAEAFSALRPDRVILTKLDEAVNFGVIVNVARQLNATFSFITTGQEVPDDIEAGHPARLARMVLDNSLPGARDISRQIRADEATARAEREALTAAYTTPNGHRAGPGGMGGGM
jgi:flagellar biosynthesis protein FlhF